MHASNSPEDETLLKQVEANNKKVLAKFAKSEQKMIGCIASIPLILFFWLLFSINVQSSPIINIFFSLFIISMIVGAVRFMLVSNKVYEDYVDLEN